VVYSPPGAAPVVVRTLDKAGLRNLYSEIRFIFQDPFASLNPRMTVRRIVGEPLLINRRGSSAEINARVSQLLELVGLDAGMMDRYPHAFSGG
jgi:peptide/nickel transport system ATP-binding protein